MKTGFLTLSTHPEHPGLVRTRIQDKPPELIPLDDGSEIRYVARFDDVEAGQMHVQNVMHGALVDLENRIYRKSLAEMIACVEADGLEHSRIWIDPELSSDELARIDGLTQRRQTARRRIDRIWQIVGIIGVVLLLIFSLWL
jgi:hypothetical protein